MAQFQALAEQHARGRHRGEWIEQDESRERHDSEPRA
jgi:hypothetical protein